MKKLLTMMMVITLVLAGCGNTAKSTAGTDSEADSPIKVGFSISTLANPFFTTMSDAATAKADELGVELTVVDAQDDSAKQMTDIEDLTVQGVDVVIVNPVDSDAITTSIESLNELEIPVITVDRAANGGKVTSHIASDNVLGGKLAGEYAIELLGGSGKVIILEGVPGASATIERGEGFEKAIDGKLEVLDKQVANFDRVEAMSVMEDLISANGDDINLVFAHNDEMALGAQEALRFANMDDVFVIGFDATDDAKTSIKAGEMDATVEQQPALMGETAVETALKIANGEEIEETVPVEVTLVTSENV